MGCSIGKNPLAQACNDDMTVRATGELSGPGGKIGESCPEHSAFENFVLFEAFWGTFSGT